MDDREPARAAWGHFSPLTQATEQRELRATIAQLEEENAALRAVILAMNERLAIMVDTADQVYAELVRQVEGLS